MKHSFDVSVEPRLSQARPAGSRDETETGVWAMRVMAIVKASKDSEAGALPDEKMLTEMGKFNEELVKAGVLLVMLLERARACMENR